MRFVERAGEFALLGEAVSGTGVGPCQVIAVTGPVASGKSTLLNFAVERSVAKGLTVLRARGLRSERRTPMALFEQLLVGAEKLPGLPETVARQLDAARFTALLHDPDSEREEHVRAGTRRSLTSALMSLIQERPVVIAVDDVQYADLPSLECLRHVMEELHTGPATVVLAWRTGLRLNRPVFGAGVLGLPGLVRLPLRALNGQAVAGVLREHLDEATARRVAPEVHRISGGSPLLVRAVVQDILRAGMEGGGRPRAAVGTVAGHAFRWSVLSCLSRVEPPVLAVARGLAILDGTTAEATLGRLVGISPGTVALSLRELRAIGLVDRGGFRSPAARDAVLAGIPREERRSLHLRAVALLRQADTGLSVTAGPIAAGPSAVASLRPAGRGEIPLERVCRSDDCA
ncbi:AAA family ATPase [Streptomyces sp. NPDC017890]|uniref:AAA family ATPase n=1 Tax=Streptomyces sp. NPDC017890 TaxID=3365015 RepID=UPI00379E2451